MSMTAFARQGRKGPWGELLWELRSVNHRYLEIAPRLPDELRGIETGLREQVAAKLRRGKVETILRYRPAPASLSELRVNRGLAEALARAGREIDSLLYNPAPVQSIHLLRWPGVLEVEEQDLGPVQTAALEVLDQALAQLAATRAREGTRLAEILRERLAGMREIVAQVRDRMPEILRLQRQRLQTRLGELKDQLDHDRLEQEMALLAQKLDVDEEMERLSVHIDEVEQVLDRDEAVGRRLDFLMQELNREANTLGSKSADVATTRASVDLKVLIEQMREQIQNIE